ncbi:hypothetical protein PWT90_03669 [Aphanocladium album]|nr:hypothetical protein PWT90_03669 [Aphanocladium album]
MSEYWLGHSPVSQPGEDALAAIAALPSDIASLHHAANQLVLHYVAMKKHVLPERKYEIQTRYADAMFTRIFTRGPGATLSEDRLPVDKSVGCCRDSALLFVALARSKGYAARIRVGFNAYTAEGYMQDHTVAEVWDPATERWRLVDADIPASFERVVQGQKVDLLDLRPGVDFQTAPQAWLALQNGTAPVDANNYTGYVSSPPELRGRAFVAHNVLHDLAALDKKELLLWEEWGTRVEYNTAVPEAEERMMDEVAAVTQHADVKIEDVKEFLKRDGLAIPNVVMLYDPYTDEPPQPVDVSRVLNE